MGNDRRLLGPACLILWLGVVAALWQWHRSDPELPTLVRAPFESSAAEAQVPSNGGRHGFILAWPKRSAAEQEDPVHVQLTPEATARGTISVVGSPADLDRSAAALSSLDMRGVRSDLGDLLPRGAAYRPWTYLGAKELPSGSTFVRIAFPDELARLESDAPPSPPSITADAPSGRPLHVWIVPIPPPGPAPFTRDPGSLIYYAATAAVILLIIYGIGRRGASRTGWILFVVWVVIAAACFLDHQLYESRKAPIRIPMQDGAAAAEFDSRLCRVKLYLSYDDRPAGPEGPRRIPLPAAAWRQGALTVTTTVTSWHNQPCLASGRWDLLDYWEPMTLGMEKAAGAFTASSEWAYLGAAHFLDGRNFVRVGMPQPPFPNGMPARVPTSMWVVPDPPEPLYDSLLKVYTLAAVGFIGLVLLAVGLAHRFLRKRSETKSSAAA